MKRMLGAQLKLCGGIASGSNFGSSGMEMERSADGLYGCAHSISALLPLEVELAAQL